MRPTRAAAVAATLLATLLGAVLGVAAPAQAGPPDFTVTTGLPTRTVAGHRSAGAVDVRRLDGGNQEVTQAKLALPTGSQVAGARFGAAVLTGDLNGDGRQDLIVGAPGTPGSAHAGPGRVYLLFGTATGITLEGAITLSPPGHAGDEFGAALAISPRFDLNRAATGIRDLWIGAPDRDVNGKKNAGAVLRYTLNPAGNPTYRSTITQNSALVPGRAEAGDRFGAVLAGGEQNGVMVGVPSEDLGRLKDAGTVQRIRTGPATDKLVKGEDWGQNAPGVPGRAEAGDRYGAALSGSGQVVGVPGEDVGAIRDAGAIQTFGFSFDGDAGLKVVPSRAFTQNSAGVPGLAEAGDRFGAAISEGVFACQDALTAAVGAPGENVGRVQDAGSITLIVEPFHTGVPGQCGSQAFSQGHGLPGKAEAGDRAGAAMGVLKGDLADAEDRYDQVQTGVPGEDVGPVRDAGRVITGTGRGATAVGRPGSDLAGLRFGSVLTGYGN